MASVRERTIPRIPKITVFRPGIAKISGGVGLFKIKVDGDWIRRIEDQNILGHVVSSSKYSQTFRRSGLPTSSWQYALPKHQ
jgi:hypothetical protein